MKCLVCGKEFEASECPRCHFPDVQIVGNREEALKKLLPTINQYRANFAGSIKFSLVTYRWKDQNGELVLDKKEMSTIGTAEELINSEKWLANKFARIADVDRITVTVCVEMGDDKKDVEIAIPNLKKAELQQLGARIDSNFNLILMLRNDTEKPTISQPVDLFVG